MYSDKLKEKKKEMGWTTEELAERSGVPIGTLNKILNGETKSPRYDTMEAIEAAFSKEQEKQMFVREVMRYDYGMDHKLYTLEDYYSFPEEVRVELINGKVFYLAAPTTIHQMAITKLIAQSVNFIEKKGGDCVPLSAPVDVQLDCDEYTMVQPDFLIVCDRDKLKDDRIYGAPEFVVEVLSPSTSMRDGNLKLRKYLAAGVQEYWIVDTERRRVISYFQEDGYIPFIYSMDAPVPVKIYDGELEIRF